MEILARILRFLFWVVVLSWSISLLRRLFGSLRNERQGKDSPKPTAEFASKRLIRDPVCGMHVAEELAIAARTGDEMVHFCSAECRDKYLRENQKLAANG